MNFQAYLEALRADATRSNYEWVIKNTVGDPERFLEVARTDRSKAENQLIRWILGSKGKLKGSTIAARLHAVRSYADFYEVSLNWAKIKKVCPPANHVARDRPPTVAEIRKLLSVCGTRERLLVLLMCGSGLRIGAFAWEKGAFMKVGDITERDSGLGLIRFYPGDPEEYRTLVSKEAMDAFHLYIEERKSVGEKVGPDSPMIRDLWEYQYSVTERYYLAQEIPRAMAVHALQGLIRRLWIRSGVKVPNVKTGDRFKQAHGFRKFAKSQLSRGGVSWEDSEVLLGHYLPYHKPAVESLEIAYLEALPFMTISEVEAAKIVNAKIKTESNQRADKIEMELLKERDNRRSLEERTSKLEKQLKSEKEELRATLERILPMLETIKQEREKQLTQS